MAIVPIESLDDPRVAAYRNLKDRDLTREGDKFMAEGELVVRRLLASSFSVESVLCAQKKAEEMSAVVPADVPLYAAPSSLVNDIVGFRFHSGVMAVGLRGPGLTVSQLIAVAERTDKPITFLVCPKIEKTDNLGSLIRVAAALGADGLILGEQSCDPFYRQSARVSMGAAFTLPIVRCVNLAADLEWLQQQHRVEIIGTVLSDDAADLAQASRGRKVALLLGNETEGLSQQWLGMCDRRLTIPMSHGTDSLNVSVAAGIFLHHFTRIATDAR